MAISPAGESSNCWETDDSHDSNPCCGTGADPRSTFPRRNGDLPEDLSRKTEKILRIHDTDSDRIVDWSMSVSWLPNPHMMNDDIRLERTNPKL